MIREGRVDVGGDIHLFYREAGSGQPIVLVHPGPGLDGSVFFPDFERMADEFRVIALDLRGNGRSDAGDPAEWSIPGFAADVAAFAEGLRLEDYTLLGHSFGAMVALQQAVDFPGHARRLVVSSGVLHRGALRGFHERLESFKPVELRDRAIAAFERESTVVTPDDCRAVWLDQLPFFLADPAGPARAELERRLAGVVYRPEMSRHEFPDFDPRPKMANLRVPVLVLGGRQDRMMPPEVTQEIADELPLTDYRLVYDAGHFAFAERPDAYFESLRTWLEDTEEVGTPG